MNIIFEKTFPKVGMPSDFPVEDYSFASNDIVVVADGVTRDSYGCSDLNLSSQEDIIRNYPKFSPAAKAARCVCSTFSRMQYGNNLERVMELANANVWKLNRNINCDYLENDYAGCVAAAVRIDGNSLYYSYICDCGVAVWDMNGVLKFQTRDDKEKVEQYIKYEVMGEYEWHLPAVRRLVRENYRNNPANRYSYGVLTGEKAAQLFIRKGRIQVRPTDIIAVYSDGFKPIFSRDDFFENLYNLENYVSLLEKEKRFGSEKTIVLLKP